MTLGISYHTMPRHNVWARSFISLLKFYRFLHDMRLLPGSASTASPESVALINPCAGFTYESHLQFNSNIDSLC